MYDGEMLDGRYPMLGNSKVPNITYPSATPLLFYRMPAD